MIDLPRPPVARVAINRLDTDGLADQDAVDLEASCCMLVLAALAVLSLLLAALVLWALPLPR